MGKKYKLSNLPLFVHGDKQTINCDLLITCDSKIGYPSK